MDAELGRSTGTATSDQRSVARRVSTETKASEPYDDDRR
jgi:hypothetical protein